MGNEKNMMENKEIQSGIKYEKGDKEQRGAEDVRKKKTLEYRQQKITIS